MPLPVKAAVQFPKPFVAPPRPAAPRVPAAYRPHAQPVAQPRVAPRPSPPPAYRPSAAAAPVVQPKAAPPKAPPAYRPAPAAARAIQRYQVLPPAKIYQNAPAKRPWGGYPYAVVGNAPFNAQAVAHGVGGVDEFLTGPGGNVANVVNHPGGLSLRLSGNKDMAIEDSNLVARQPKAFYATNAVIAASNQRLTAAHSHIQLAAGAHSITIWTGWWSQKVLTEVTPTYRGGSPDQMPQNCNAVGAAVMGWEAEAAAGEGGRKALGLGARLAPTALAAYKDAYNAPGELDEAPLLNDIAREYVTTSTPRARKALGINQFARPGVGEGFMIATLGSGVQQPNGLSRVRDYGSNTDRDLGWAFHFAGVVAKSGKDYVTLENYARGDNRQGHADPRWYFQMYGEAQGQTFHEFHEARQDYANPLTHVVNSQTHGTGLHRL